MIRHRRTQARARRRCENDAERDGFKLNERAWGRTLWGRTFGASCQRQSGKL